MEVSETQMMIGLVLAIAVLIFLVVKQKFMSFGFNYCRFHYWARRRNGASRRGERHYRRIWQHARLDCNRDWFWRDDGPNS